MCWYRLDEGDADPATFFHYLSLAAKSLVPKNPTAPSGSDARVCAWVTDLYAAIFPRVVCAVAASLRTGAGQLSGSALDICSAPIASLRNSGLPEHVSVLVAEPPDPPPPLVTVQCDRGMTVIGADSLTLSRGQSHRPAALEEKGGRRHANLVDEAYRRVGGWAAGLNADGRTGEGDRRVSGSGLDGTSETIFRYLAGGDGTSFPGCPATLAEDVRAVRYQHPIGGGAHRPLECW